MNKTLVLTGDDVAEMAMSIGIDNLMDDLIARTTAAFETFHPDAFELPPRSGFYYRNPDFGLVEWMPLFERAGRILLKIVGYHPTNPTRRGLPTILSTLAVFSKESGRLESIIDGALATAMRTGAASSVASRLMAKPDSRVLGLVGCGAQAVTQLHALSRQFDFEQVLVFDRDPQIAESLSHRAAACGFPADRITVSPLRTVVSGADILCVATSVEVGHGPVFPDDCETKPWVHINAVGSDFPGKVEIPAALLRESFVCPDFRPQAEIEGECQQLAPDEIGPDILQLAQAPTAYGDLRNRRTVFDSTGFAFEDYIAVSLLVEEATARNKGMMLEIETAQDDPRNPYEFLLDKIHPAKKPEPSPSTKPAPAHP